MSYCNKEASIALKEVGFDEQCFAYFTEKGDSYVGDHVNCSELVTISRPDHLQASDWLMVKSDGVVKLVFDYIYTMVSVYDERLDRLFERRFSGLDHRNDAIIAACEIIKETTK